METCRDKSEWIKTLRYKCIGFPGKAIQTPCYNTVPGPEDPLCDECESRVEEDMKKLLKQHRTPLRKCPICDAREEDGKCLTNEKDIVSMSCEYIGPAEEYLPLLKQHVGVTEEYLNKIIFYNVTERETILYSNLQQQDTN